MARRGDLNGWWWFGIVVVGFWPWEPGYSHELQVGEQKTHTLWLHFGPPTTGDRLPSCTPPRCG